MSPRFPSFSRATARLTSALLVAGIASAASAACSSSPSSDPDAGGASCPSAPSCPQDAVPSYANEILPILQTDCIPCHSPSGSAGYDETTYAQVSAQYGAMPSQVAICAMPPVNGPQMSSAQRVALTAWLKCGAPNN